MSIGLKSDSNGTSGSIVINGSDAVLVTPTGITTASIQDSSITTAKIASGNITFDTLSTSATEADNVASRVAKAWVNFDGTTNTGGNCTIRADFNVSTVADNGTGDYTINFSTAMTSINYSFVGSSGFTSNGASAAFIAINRIGANGNESAPTTESCRVNAVDAAGNTNLDLKYMNFNFFE